MTASKLVRPAAEYKDSVLTALREYQAEGCLLHHKFALVREDFEAFVALLRAEKGAPHQPFQEWVEPVPETIVWLVKDGAYIGTACIRHRLNWHLEKWGGHLRFMIRPSMRGKGYGRKLLLKAMPVANHLGIDNALLTIDPDNAAAIRVVESCGGVFADDLAATDQFPARRRYWLDCT